MLGLRFVRKELELGHRKHNCCLPERTRLGSVFFETVAVMCAWRLLMPELFTGDIHVADIVKAH